jgi:hypothetical protein
MRPQRIVAVIRMMLRISHYHLEISVTTLAADAGRAALEILRPIRATTIIVGV